MGMMKFDVPHSLDKAEARARITKLLDYWSRKYGLKTVWTGDRVQLNGKAMGISINGQLEVSDTAVGGEASDPGFLFRDKAKRYLTEKFQTYLDPAIPRDRLPEGD